MGQWDKLINQVLQVSKDLRYDELSKVLIRVGYKPKQPRGGSSHVTFRKKGKKLITIPKGNPVNSAYIELVREVIIGFESESYEND